MEGMQIAFGLLGGLAVFIYGMNMMSSVRDAFESWMASDGHRANILDSEFNSFGVGMYAVKKNGAWYYYWCQTFAVYN